MWAFPLVASVVAFAFAAILARQFLRRRRPFHVIWSIALVMYGVASFAMFLGVLHGWSASGYRVYWVFGAVLNVPYLFLGELFLLVRRRRVSDGVLVLVVSLTAFAISNVGSASLHTRALGSDLPLGKDVFGDGALPYRLAQYLAYPAFILLLVASLWSARRMRGRPELRDRFVGTMLIAIGATIVAIGSGVGAGLDVVPVFSIGLLAGIAVMFWGFLRASHPTPSPVPASPSAS